MKKTKMMETAPDMAINRIVEGTAFQGEIHCESNIRIDGSFTGSINTKGRLVVGPTGKVEGDIVCQNSEIEGSVKGKLQVRDGVLNAGDYDYEPNGVLHGATTALEDSEYLFICDGPVLFYNDDGLQSYLGWEELHRMRAAAGAAS